VNGAAINKEMQVSFWYIILSPLEIPLVEFLDHMGLLFLVF
jgi:hypothetical protein